MRALFLVRHGEPDFPDDRKYFLGWTDLSLSRKGREQAAALREFFREIPDKTVFCSPLKRADETLHLAGIKEYTVRPEFKEINAGIWDGRAFDEIRSLFPEEYEERGRDLVHYAIPGGESFADCGKRAAAGLDEIRKDFPSGNLCIFTHAGTMKMLHSHLTGKDACESLNTDRLYCSVVSYLADEKDVYEGAVFTAGSFQKQIPDEEESERLLLEFKTPENVKEHCRAVANKALELCEKLNRQGAGLNEKAVAAGALLHDIARTEKQHAKKGALWLNEKGYTALAPIVGDHMTLPAEEERISEKSVVFLADKLVKGTETVTLKQRYFPEGMNEEQRRFRGIRYAQAVRIAKMMGIDPDKI